MKQSLASTKLWTSLAIARRATAGLLTFTFILPLHADVTVPAQTVGSGQTLEVFDHGEVTTTENATTVQVEVQSGGTAVFRSAARVRLLPGFMASSGSFFHAAFVLSQSIPLAWTVSSGAVRYDIYRNGVKIGEATTTNYTDTTAQPGQVYTYTIKAVAGGGAETLIATIQGASARSFEVFTPLQ